MARQPRPAGRAGQIARGTLLPNHTPFRPTHLNSRDPKPNQTKPNQPGPPVTNAMAPSRGAAPRTLDALESMAAALDAHAAQRPAAGELEGALPQMDAAARGQLVAGVRALAGARRLLAGGRRAWD